LDPEQISDLLWMAQLLVPDLSREPADEALADGGALAIDQIPVDPPDLESGLLIQSLANDSGKQEPDGATRRSPEALLEPATAAGPLPAGTPRVAVAEAGLLPRPRRIGRALQSLNRWVEAGPATLLDLPATVEAVARARAVGRPWRPVLRPPLQPWLGLHLVFDGHPSMALWHQLRRELPRTLRQQVRWRDLRCWRLREGRDGSPVELLGTHGRRVAPCQLQHPRSRDLVLVVSDAIGGCWRDGTMASLLHNWAGQQPVVLLQVLPSRLWARTALGQQEHGWVQARLPLEPNALMRWQPLDTAPTWLEQSPALPSPGILTLPLTTFNPSDLGAMARLLAGGVGASQRAVRFELPAPLVPADAPASGPASDRAPDSQLIEQQLAQFLYMASPQSLRLMGLLTFAPVITLPVVRLIQRQQVAGSGPAEIAEVLFSGLFRNLVPTDQGVVSSIPVDRQQLCLVSEHLRPHLRQGLLVGEARAVFDAVSEHVAHSLNLSVDAFEALLRTPAAMDERADQSFLQAFARVSLACLRGLGQGYEDFADAIEAAGWVKEPVTPEDLPANFEPFTLSYETARLEEITLQPITFTTCELDAQLRRRNSQGQGWALREPLGADGSLGLTMVQIPGGSFAMGSPPDEQERRSDEGPQHDVTLASFLMSQTPITQAQWREVAEWQPPQGEKWARDLIPKPSRFKGDDRPVESVSWHDAIEFCNRLRQRTGRQYTLPSEAQWEYACRAATTMPFHFGATITPKLVNYNGNYTYAKGPKGAYREQTTSVASFPANAWGLHDMHGNVWEWCLDHFHESYEGAPVDGRAWLDPVKSEEEDHKKGKLLRGGSWLNDRWFCRSASRIHYRPDDAYLDVGFRVVCLPQGPSLNS
jgi:formylglycine-generating enzyme required for sulfatase activity